MIEHAQAGAEANDQPFIETLRARYETKGFAFIVDPEAPELPAFMKSYRPDAIASKSGRNVAIAIKGRQSSTALRSLQQIRRLFDDQPDWQLDVVFAGGSTMRMPVISSAKVLDHKREILALSADGHRRAALVMAWSLLEAALQSIGIAENKARSAVSVLDVLASEGYVEPDMERRLRPLVELRDRIVHGDVLAEPTVEDVAVVLASIDQTLLADAA